MEKFVRYRFFSKQGHSTKHMFSSFREYSPRIERLPEIPREKIEPVKYLEMLKKTREAQEKNRINLLLQSNFKKSTM